MDDNRRSEQIIKQFTSAGDHCDSGVAAGCKTTRLAVLEHKLETLTKRLADLEVALRISNIKLDEKLRADDVTLRIMEGRLSTVGKAVELMAAKLDDTSVMASKAHRIVDRHSTIGRTLLKIGSIVAFVLSCTWAIIRYFVTF